MLCRGVRRGAQASRRGAGHVQLRYGETEIPSLIRYIAPGKQSDPTARECLNQAAWGLAHAHSCLFESLKGAIPLDPSEDEAVRFTAKLSYSNRVYLLKLIDRLKELPALCARFGDAALKRKLPHIRRSSKEISDKLEPFAFHRQEPSAANGNRGYIFWLEKPDNGGGYSLCASLKELNAKLDTDLWGQPIPIVLTSGTLSVHGCFSHIKHVMGLFGKGRLTETSQPSPFDYKHNTMLYLPEFMPFPEPRGAAYLMAVTDEIVKLIRVTAGHTLVLFTSYWLMEKVFGNVKKRILNYPLFLMGQGRLEVLDSFKESGNGVLFASDTCGEGIDIAGDTLSSLIIVKLPFAVPDPITRYEQTLYPSVTDYLDAVTVPNMLIKLKQYAGRLIRSETDTGILSILDSRALPGGRYYGRILDSLFETTVTSGLNDVWAFLQNRKESGYIAMSHPNFGCVWDEMENE